MINTTLIRALLGAALAAGAALAQAGVVTIASRSAFNAQGQIAYNSNFDDFGRGFHYPGYGFTRGDVSYVSDENLVVGAGTRLSVGASRAVMTNEYWSPLVAEIAGGTLYTLLGFDAAVTSGLVSVTVDTNRGSYQFGGVSLPNGASSFGFQGFGTTDAGEYFTGFRIDTQGLNYLAGVTNVAVGTARVPEPGSIALLLAGLAMLGTVRGRRARRSDA
ncbi:MAG: PEP-CTERM sorting domain-containing protein [Pseudomonadota bacterium]